MSGNDRLFADDVAARDDALDVTRSFIVQAPAGSGKTELLIQRYLRLLSTVDQPEEIIAITFTRKAAAEMQYRIVAALRAAARGENPSEPHEQRTAALAAAALEQDTRRQWSLLGNPSRMRIQTLDSLNASIARARPISAPASAGGVRVVVDAELAALHRAAAVSTLDYLAEPGPLCDAATEVLSHLDNNTSIYVDYLARMLGTRDQWLPFTGSGSLTKQEALGLRALLEENLQAAVRERLTLIRKLFPETIRHELATLFDYAAGNLAEQESPASPVCALAGLADLPPVDPSGAPQWAAVAELLLTQAGGFRKQVDKRLGFPAGQKAPKDQMKGLLHELAEHEQLAQALHDARTLPPVRYDDEQWAVLLALFRLLPLASVELQRLFGEQGVADHVDIARAAAAALGTAQQPGDVALLLDYQVRHLLVDEMQDTSSAQYRMLEALTGGWTPGDGRTLYCVGDPMQSIYRFRNAEVGQFLLARTNGIGGVALEPLVLRRNFRSGDALVDWFNAVFPGVLSEKDDPASGSVSYSAALAVPQQNGVGEVRVHPVFGNDKDHEARIGCKVIQDTLQENPGEQVAVLVRGRNQLPDLLAQLRLAGIDYRAVEIDKLTDLPEIIEVLALTRAAVHSADRIAWLGLLRAPWIALGWADLHNLVAGDRYATVPELLSDETRLGRLSSRGRAAVLASMPVLERLTTPRPSMTLRDLVEDCWLALGGPAILPDRFAIENVYRFLDVLAKHERHGSLDDVAALEKLLDLERVSTSGTARLQVMTMHKSKGLEFEHVLLFGLGRLPGNSGRSVLSWTDLPDEHGNERKIISPVGPRVEVDRDPVHRFIDQSENAKDRHEQSRLLYVACTRARKTLHLLGHTLASADGCKPPARSSLLRQLWPAVERQYKEAFDPALVVEARDEQGMGEPVLRRFRSPWRAPEIAALPGLTLPGANGAAGEEKVEFYWVGTEARIAGTIVHRWLQVLAEGRVEGRAKDTATRDNVTRRWLREMGIGDEAQSGIVSRVGDALGGVLDDEKGRWLLEGAGHAELGLTGIYEGEVESVVLDRVRIADDGTHWIVDYKTSTHEGGNLKGFLDAEIARYTPQLRKYEAIYTAWAGVRARCALYFPLLREFVEIQ